MDSRQSTLKRSFDMMELQNQVDNMESTSKKDKDSAKKTKQLEQELDPLKIPNILEKVFSYLDPDSIKNARQVNQLWSVEGAKSLISKCFVQIPRDKQYTDLESDERIEFIEFLSLKLSDRSMIPNIIVGTLGDFDVWHSLEVLGPQVKAVKLKIMHPVDKLLLKLLDFLPNLKYLNIQDVPLHNCIITAIIKSVMSEEENIGKTLVISNMNFQAYNELKLTEFEGFSNCTNIMMEELKFDINSYLFLPNMKVRLAKILSKLLSTNQNTLKKLTLINCQCFLSLIEFPCMTALTHIDLGFCPNNVDQTSGCKFHPTFRFSEKLPNLQEFSADCRSEHRLFPLAGFLQQTAGPAPSVRRVKYLYDHTNLDVEFLFKTFPNVEDLQIRVNESPQTLFDSLWILGTNLRKLHLTFYGGAFQKSFYLDCIFTGFTQGTVEWIKSHPNLEPCTLEELEGLRVYPSILNLKELEQITIDWDINANGCIFPRTLLTVAGKYAFRFLPKKPQLTVNLKGGIFDNLVLKWVL